MKKKSPPLLFKYILEYSLRSNSNWKSKIKTKRARPSVTKWKYSIVNPKSNNKDPLLREPKGSLILPPFHAMLFVQDISYGLASLASHTLLYRISFMDLFVAYIPQQDAEPGGMGDVSPSIAWNGGSLREPSGSLFFLTVEYIAYESRIPICLKVII